MATKRRPQPPKIDWNRPDDPRDRLIAEQAVEIEEQLARITLLEQQRSDFDTQTQRLATYILRNHPGEPSRSEGTIDCAIRIMSKLSSAAPTPNRGGTGYYERLIAALDLEKRGNTRLQAELTKVRALLAAEYNRAPKRRQRRQDH